MGKRKVIALLLAVAMVIGALVGCGSKDAGTAGGTTSEGTGDNSGKSSDLADSSN